MTRRPFLAALAALALLVTACGGDDDAGSAAGEGSTLAGTLAIGAGTCAGEPGGSWFRMVQPGGTVEDGPFVDNPDSPCEDTTITPLTPGTDGGIVLGEYQPQPDPVFDDGGGSLAAGVIAPVGFFAVNFGVSTNATDPQTGEDVPAPEATVDGDALTVDLRALSVSWNGQHFNQGAPSAAGEGPPATGTYDDATAAYTLDWTTTIVGGPFNNFTGIWHLEGTFEPS